MPSSAILHAACFTAGVVIGGGLVSAVSSKHRQTSSPPIPTGKPIPPIVNIGTNGDARITNSAAVVALSPPVLKYGNPGSWDRWHRIHAFMLCICPGPIADMLVRKAYVAGYDRRLRHPAWVCQLQLQEAYSLDCPVDSRALDSHISRPHRNTFCARRWFRRPLQIEFYGGSYSTCCFPGDFGRLFQKWIWPWSYVSQIILARYSRLLYMWLTIMMQGSGSRCQDLAGPFDFYRIDVPLTLLNRMLWTRHSCFPTLHPK